MDCLNDAAVDLAEWLRELLWHVGAEEQFRIGKASQTSCRVNALRNIDSSGLGPLGTFAGGVFGSVIAAAPLLERSGFQFRQCRNLLVARHLR